MNKEYQKITRLTRYWNEKQIFKFLQGHLQDTTEKGHFVSLMKNTKGKLNFVISNSDMEIIDVREIETLKDLYDADYDLRRDFGLESYITGICSNKDFTYQQHEHLRESIIHNIINRK